MTTAELTTCDQPADHELVASALSGSPEAFGALAARYRAPMYGIAYRFTRSRETADDVVQTALMRAYRHLDSFRGERSFLRWICAIARNTSLEAIRRNRRHAACEWPLPTPLPGPEEIVIQREEASHLHSAVEALPEQSREAIKMHYLDGLKYREIADGLGIPLGTVKTNISRGKRRLREHLEHRR